MVMLERENRGGGMIPGKSILLALIYCMVADRNLSHFDGDL
jgi:hypothetical protein